MNPENPEIQSSPYQMNHSFWEKLQDRFPFSLLMTTEKGEVLYQNIHDEELTTYLEECRGVNCEDATASHKAFFRGDISEFREELKLENDRIMEICGFRIEKNNIFMFQDISDIRRLEYLIKENERRMRSLLDASKDVFLIVSEEGIIRNQQNSSDQGIFLGEKLKGKKLWDFLEFKKDKTEIERAFVSSHEGGGCQIFEASYQRNHQQCYLEIRIVPGIGRDVVVLVHDMTELHIIDEHLHMLERNASFVDIATGMSNELLNRIQSIRSCIGPLRLGEIPSSLDPYLNKIEEESRQSEEILRNLFTFSGNNLEDEQTFLIKEAIDKAFLFCSYGIPDGIVMQKKMDDEDIKIKSPSKQLIGVLINLIMNAREAIDGKGLIEINQNMKDLHIEDRKLVQGSWNPGKFVEISVRDNGSGMTQSMIDKIFEPLFSTKSEKDSTGMGLTILKGFIKKQEGGIWVESQPDKGTCFHLYFPDLKQGKQNSADASRNYALDYLPQDLPAEELNQQYDFAPMEHQQAIGLLEGNEELYHIICKDFILDYGQSALFIEEKLRENDWENARIIVHSIKGLAGLVGSNELQEQARKYEIILKNKDLDELHTTGNRFNAILAYVVQELEEYLQGSAESIESNSPVELEEDSFDFSKNLIEDLKQISGHIEYSEYNEAMELIARYKEYREGDQWDFIVQSLENWVRQFHFDDALKFIKKYT